MSEPLRVELAAGDGPVALQDFLERRWPGVHRTYLRQLVAAGAVRVNSIAAAPRTRLTPGDVVELCLEPDEGLLAAPAAPPPAPRLLHLGDGWLVVDKPTGWRQVDRAGASVQAWLAAAGHGDDWLPVWRMDAEASGCSAWARGRAGQRAARDRAAAGDVRLEWTVLVEGTVAPPRLRLDAPLGPDRARPGQVRVVAAASKGARAARTEVAVVERFRNHTLLRCVLLTDHGHQLRAHLASTHHPVVGDADYRGSRRLLLSRIKPGYKLRRGAAERPLLERMFLHAGRLDAAGAAVAAAPLPADLAVAVDKLRRFASPS